MSMKLLLPISIFLVSLAPSSRAYGEVPQMLRVGNWVNAGPRNILGAGGSLVVTLSQTNTEWTISFTSIHYPSVNDRATPTKETRGPFPVTAKEGILSFKDGDQSMEYSYAFGTNGLMLPAFLKADDRTWKFRSPSGEGVFRYEFDPFITPVGKAEFPTTAPIEHPRYYVYERGPNIRPQNDRARQLRFLVRMPDGSLYGDPKFIWDEYGQPRIEGSSWYHTYKESLYMPLSSEDLKMIKLLPNNSTSTNRNRISSPDAK